MRLLKTYSQYLHIKYVLPLVLLLCFPYKGFSQTTDSLTGMKGFYLNIGNSYSVALKYWLSPKTAAVAGVSIYGNTYNISPQVVQQPSVATTVSVFGRFQYFLTDRKQFMPYLSAGGNIGSQWSWNPGSQANSLSLGLGGGIGMECFILPWLTISGELGLSASYSGLRQENPSVPVSQSVSSWTYGIGQSGIVFTVYF